jgi:hypothetical protein
MIGEQIKGRTTLDPQAPELMFTPLTWAPTPDSLPRRLFEDSQIDSHLEALAARQQPDGGWPIYWPPVSPACELEYRGVVTVGALKTLQAYDRL